MPKMNIETNTGISSCGEGSGILGQPVRVELQLYLMLNEFAG